jgi:hypothetical protein
VGRWYKNILGGPGRPAKALAEPHPAAQMPTTSGCTLDSPGHIYPTEGIFHMAQNRLRRVKFCRRPPRPPSVPLTTAIYAYVGLTPSIPDKTPILIARGGTAG